MRNKETTTTDDKLRRLKNVTLKSSKVKKIIILII